MDGHEGHDHERRKHRVCITGNTEYHLHDNVCVAVKDLATGQFVEEHAAIGKELVGGINMAAEVVAPNDPHAVEPGDCLCFQSGKRSPLLTSRMVGSRRPSKDTVLKYRIPE